MIFCSRRLLLPCESLMSLILFFLNHESQSGRVEGGWGEIRGEKTSANFVLLFFASDFLTFLSLDVPCTGGLYCP